MGAAQPDRWTAGVLQARPAWRPMTARFNTFSFVDRITEVEPARRAVGQFSVPGTVGDFPPCLVAEAIGQLAAWVAMANVDFARRPVAALAGTTLFHHDVVPGSQLTLEVVLANCDEDNVAYGGTAHVDGAKVLELFDCLGPMMPQDAFDDPGAVRDRFAVLRGPGAAPGRFPGIAPRELTIGQHVIGESVAAQLHIPKAAAFFGDHFPRRPVFPATLLIDAQIRLAGTLMAQRDAQDTRSTLTPTCLRDMKIRAWMLPGETVDLAAQMLPRDGDAWPARLTARVAGKTVATSRVEFAPRMETS